MEAPSLSSIPAVITVDVPQPDMSSPGLTGRARVMLDTVSNNFAGVKQKILNALPKNFSVWLIAITCLIVLVAVSRIITLQKSVTELQSRPVVDENMIRVAVRKHLEETVKAMEQHNKAQAMARQAEEAAARQAEAQRLAAEQQKAQALREEALRVEAEAKAEAKKREEAEALARKEAEDLVRKEAEAEPTKVVAELPRAVEVEKREPKEELDEEEEKPVVVKVKSSKTKERQ
jgi:hypothetical protein